MTPAPALTVDEPRTPVTAVAVLLHGGRSSGQGPVRPGQLAVLRMLPFARALQAAGAADGLVVARVRYAVRGWNGSAQSPVADARWALGQLQDRFRDAPVGIVGHSMGGRTALYIADHPNIRAVVALAPWIESGDPVEQLAGRRILIAHGTQDRMTSARKSAEYARRATAVAESVSYISVNAERHAMLRRARVWHELAAGYVSAILLGRTPEPAARDATAEVLREALAGQESLVV